MKQVVQRKTNADEIFLVHNSAKLLLEEDDNYTEKLMDDAF